MRMLAGLVGLLALSSLARADELDPKRTYAVIVGVLEWKDESFSSFPKEARKDQELYDTLARRGVPESQRVLLLDEQATAAAMTAAVERMVAKTPAGSTFLFYYAGHGMHDDDGDYVFASVDIRSSDPRSGFHLSTLIPILRRLKDAQVLLLADCCYSGGLATVARAVATANHNHAVSLTSADAADTSTSNWTYTQILIDALGGREVIDLDDDKKISLAELHTSVTDAMKYREQQPSGYANYGVREDLTIATAHPSARRLDRARRGAWVLADNDGDREPARVLGTGADGRLRVAFYDYATETEAWMKPSAVKSIESSSGGGLDAVVKRATR
jgi:hypothetical protein